MKTTRAISVNSALSCWPAFQELHKALPSLRHLYMQAVDAQQHNDNFYDTSVEKYANQPLRQITLRDMLVFGKDALRNPKRVITSARVVQEELPKRLARRLLDLQFLPHIVVTNPHIRSVYDAYYLAFNELRGMPRVRDLNDNAAFTRLLVRLIDEHAPMLDALAVGLKECQHKSSARHHLQLDSFLDGMLRSRISRRVIAEQHVHLLTPRPHHVGIINTRLNLHEAIQSAAQRTQQLCSESYGAAPDVLIDGDVGATMPQVGAHLDYILYELFKNAMRAVVERVNPPAAASAESRRGGPLPPIRVRICDGSDMVTIRLSDEGGGIPEQHVERVWDYGFTTVAHMPPASEARDGLQLSDLMQPSSGQAGQFKMAGLGFGLPMARLHARYFGGDLRLVSLPTYGVDVFLNLRHLEESEWAESHDIVHHVPKVVSIPTS